MLNKQPNSIVTLAAVLLALVGVHQPAKAFLLAQADTTPTTFTTPDKLPAQAQVNMATSNSTTSINQSLKASFLEKYPQAKVNLKTQSSAEALQGLSEGKVDLVGIGRNLTATEKQQGFVAVPISREKIAIVISKDNPYEGNLTISQFAQIFRGEITDWSEIGGNPGKINLVDAPDTNDTRQAFPGYPVFSDSEFVAGSNAVKLDQDTTDKMVAQLGANGMGYAVANDVINRDDVKIVTMHQTQPDDARYPFSQPFYLVYQGTPSDTTKAFLGFATNQGGAEVIANRVGSISSVAAVATASKLGNQANKLPSGGVDLPKTTVDGNGKTAPLNADAKTNNSVAGTGTDAGTGEQNGITGTDDNTVAQADADKTTNNGKSSPGNGTADANIEGSGEVNPNIEGSGEVNPNIEGSGEVNPNIEGSGEVNPNIEGSGEVNPNVEDSGEPNAAIDSEDKGTVATANKGSWWWWLLGIPILAGLAFWGFGGKKRGDNEPAVGDPSNIEPGGRRIPGEPSPDSDLSAVGANAATNLDSVATTSKLSSGAIATGGAAIAGGTAAAANFVRGKRTPEEEIEQIDLELDDPNRNIDNPVIEEIPSNPVTEFTGQETKLQSTEQSTKLQPTGQETKLQGTEQSTKLQPDITEGINENTSGLLDGIPDLGGGAAAAGGAAVVGGAAAASGWFGDRDSEQNLENPTYTQEEYVSEQPTRLQTTNFDSDFEDITTDESAVDSNLTVDSPVAQEFSGDFVLDEETTTEPSIRTNGEISGEWENERTNRSDFASESTISFETPDVIDTEITEIEDNTARENTSGLFDSNSNTGSAAAFGGVAASGWFGNRDRDQTPDTDADTEVEEVNLDRESGEWENERANRSDFASESTISFETPDVIDTEITEIEDNTARENTSGLFDSNSNTGSAAAFGGVAASGWFDNRDRDQTPDTQNADFEGDTSVNLTDSSENSDINLDEITFDDVDNSTNASLEEITFDNTENLNDINLEEITFDDVDNSTNASLEEITFDNTENLNDISLDEITFDDVDDSTNASMDNFIFKDNEGDSTDNLIDSLDNTSNDPEISLDDLNFDQSGDDFTSNLSGNNTAKTTDLSDVQTNDMNNISTWLDSLEMPSQSSEDITGWLDQLNLQDHDSKNNLSNQKDLQLEDETNKTEDISFQFLEDLLERDAKNNKDNQ
jgi:ABC-type phosphate transport system substrate-binding protein